MGLFDEMLENDQKEMEETSNINGVAIGVVKENWDDKHPGMVKVELSLGSNGKNMTDWIPVAVPYAGNNYGNYFLPEIGSQVLLAFHMGDVNCPIVIGCLWNQTDVVPAGTANQKNTIKRILTKGGNSITVSEEEGKEQIFLKTKGGLEICLDDEKQTIKASDKDGKNGLTIDSKNSLMEFVSAGKAVFKIDNTEMLILDGTAKKVKIKADAVSVEANQTLKMKAQSLEQEGASTELKGKSFKIESQGSLAVKGTGVLKLESSGITEVKGAMLKLN